MEGVGTGAAKPPPSEIQEEGKPSNAANHACAKEMENAGKFQAFASGAEVEDRSEIIENDHRSGADMKEAKDKHRECPEEMEPPSHESENGENVATTTAEEATGSVSREPVDDTSCRGESSEATAQQDKEHPVHPVGGMACQEKSEGQGEHNPERDASWEGEVEPEQQSHDGKADTSETDASMSDPAAPTTDNSEKVEITFLQQKGNKNADSITVPDGCGNPGVSSAFGLETGKPHTELADSFGTALNEDDSPDDGHVQPEDSATSKYDDKVNNNIQKQSIHFETESTGTLGISVEKLATCTNPSDTASETAKPNADGQTKIGFQPQSKPILAKEQDRSMLMRYLGLQPVLEMEKIQSKDHCDKSPTSSVRQKFGFSFPGSFSTMPSLDLMDPCEKINSMKHALPFEVCSEGSRSPEPPILAETPVVGSSPPRHNYDAMEAQMIDMTPRTTSMIEGGDPLGSMLMRDQKDLSSKSALCMGHSTQGLVGVGHTLTCQTGYHNGKNESMKFATKSHRHDLTRTTEVERTSAIFPPDIPCPRCNRTFKSRNQLRGHLRWHIHDPINLLAGRWQAENGQSTGKATHSDEVKCSKDGTAASAKFGHQASVPLSSAQKNYQQRPGSQKSFPKGDAFSCNFCLKKFQTPLKLRGHMMVHKRKQTKARLLLEKKTGIRNSSQNSFRCEVCSKVFDTKLKLRGHMTSHAKEFHPRSKGVKRFRTNSCSNKGEPKGGIQQREKNSTSGVKQKVMVGVKKSFKCDICLKTFPSLRACNGHKGIHSMKWQLASNMHHLGRPSKRVKSNRGSELPVKSDQEETLKSTLKEKAGVTPKEEEETNKSEMSTPCDASKAVKQNKIFKCSLCALVFATKHRVRKHLFKVHSDVSAETTSFSEEHVDGCRFCEVFKKRKRGRPKRGENTLVVCAHGKRVIGYNLPLSQIKSLRKNKRSMMKNLAPHKFKKPKQADDCHAKTAPVVKTEHNSEATVVPESEGSQGYCKSESLLRSSRRRGRPPKKPSTAVMRLKAKRNALYRVNGVKSRLVCDGTNVTSISSFRKHGQPRKITFLGRHLKSGWDPKKQRFIGRPYKCHLCKMSYRSERQLCSHMRSHGIHVFDLSQLPLDQQGDGTKPHDFADGGSEVLGKLEQNDGKCDATETEYSKGCTPPVSDSTRKSSESGVGGTCSVCTKEFDSDNMFHQHLLGRYNKKCRQEWMKHTFGFGMRSKVTVPPQEEEGEDVSNESAAESNEDVLKDLPADKNNGNLCVIDKIGMGSFPGHGVFGSLQQNNSRSEKGVHGDTSVQVNPHCSTPSADTDVQQLFKLGTSAYVDAVPQSLPSPRKGAVLDAVINRLTQSTKVLDSNGSENELTVETSASTQPTSSHPETSKLLFKCHLCAKTFNRKQKLCVHSRIHKPKIATVMDHIEHATQRSIAVSPTSSNGSMLAKEKETDEGLPNNPVEAERTSDATAEEVPPLPKLPLTYPCTECHKQFPSTIKLANHLKMHKKSTKTETSHPVSHAKMSHPENLQNDVSSGKRRDVDIGPSNTQSEREVCVENGQTSSASQVNERQGPENDVSLKTDGSNKVHTAVSMNSKSNENVAEGSVKKGENGKMSQQPSIPARPRLLLKIDPVTLQRLHVCEDCPKSFKSRRQLANHRRLHAVDKFYAEKQFAKDQELPQNDNQSCATEASVETNANEIAKPDNLSFEQSGYNGNEPPINSAHDGNFSYLDETAKCKICDKVMQKCLLDDHMKFHTEGLLTRSFDSTEDNDKNGDQQCVDASKDIVGRGELNHSVPSGFKASQPDSNRLPHLSGEPTPIHSEDGLLTSDAMETDFPGMNSDQTSTKANEDILHIPETNPPSFHMEQLICNVCSVPCENYQQLFEHMKSHSGSSLKMADPAPTPDNVAPIPAEMKKQQSSQGQRFNYMRPKIYPCELCRFSFSSFRQFRVHITQAHGGKFQYRLKLQQKEAAETGAFNSETDAMNKTHPHKCDVCGRRFKRLALLIFHLNKLHKGWKQRLCMLDTRNRARASQTVVQNVAEGSNSPAAPGDLPFTCELCGKSFRMKVQLCGHMKTHGRVGHSPIKISPMKLKGKYTLRKRGKPDFRLSDEWILDMDDEQVAFDRTNAMQSMPERIGITETEVTGCQPVDAYYASRYPPSQLVNDMSSQNQMSRMAQHSGQYDTTIPVPEPSLESSAIDLKIPTAPPPPDPSKFITIQMEPVSQQMLHRCLLCHSYFSSQASAIFHCKEVHFKKKPKFAASADVVQGNAHPLGGNPSAAGGPLVNARLPPHLPPRTNPTISHQAHALLPEDPDNSPSTYGRVTSPPLASQYQLGGQQPSLPYAGTLPKPPTVSTGKMISQTPFNEMLYRVEMSEGQTRYVCNTCKSTFLHYNFLMSHLAEHNHLAYTCLQCGYATYSEKDYQLHCQLHDGQISKKIRRVRPKPLENRFKQSLKPSRPFPRAVATCHICQRSFVNLKGLQAHMVFHSANFSSISERRNESKRGQKKNSPLVQPLPSFEVESPAQSPHLENVDEQTEALDLSCKPVSYNTESDMDEVLDLSIGSRSNTQELQEPPGDVAKNIVTVPGESPVASLPDVCQVLQKADQHVEHVEPNLTPVEKPTPTTRKPKNSIRLVGAIDVDVASLENKYSVVTDLMDTDSDISPDLPSHTQESTLTIGEVDGENDGKSPKKLRSYKCSMCQYATDFKDSMDRHEQKHRKFRTLACHQCSYRTPEKRLMLRHVLTIHEKQKPYQCELCNYSSAYKHHLKRHHTKRHQRPLLTCTLCEFTTEDVAKLESHSTTHQEPKVYRCKSCPMVFTSSKLFKAHKQIVHKKKKKSKKGSPEQSVSSSSREGSSESSEAKESDTPSPPGPEEPESLKHQCKLCTYQTNDQNELTKHLMKNHFGNQVKDGLGDVCTTAQCPQCGYVTGKNQMKAHMQIHDTGEFFNCEQCTFKAGSQAELDGHVQQKHKVKATAKLMCKMCGMHFWDADDMKLHTEVHLRDTTISLKNPFICSLCPLKLMNRRDAVRHLQLHTDRYPFKCRYCVFSCFTKASIQRHLTIHKHATKARPVAAARKNSRKSLSATSSSSGSECGLSVDGPMNPRQIPSSKCPTNFGAVANRLPIYECQYCSHTFRVAEEWQRHEKRHCRAWPD